MGKTVTYIQGNGKQATTSATDAQIKALQKAGRVVEVREHGKK
jgi:hypothetical protein